MYVELWENFKVIKPKFIISGKPFIPSVEEALSIGDSESIGLLRPKVRILEIKRLYQDALALGSHVDPATYRPLHTADPKTQLLCGSFSSGTTGKQKAVVLKGHALLRSLFVACQHWHSISQNGPTFNPSQFNWISWWFTLLYSTHLGWTRIFVDNVDLDSILGGIDKYKPEFIFCGPSLVAKMVHRLEEIGDRWDFSSAKAFVIGGDMMNKFAHERFASKFSHAKLYQSYGATEIGLVLESEIGQPVVYGSVGKPLSPLKLVDATTGEEVTKPNTPGEIVVKWVVMREYVDNPEETAKVLDENGWFKTGDVAVFDESGNYFIVDRIKEMFRYRGFEVYPSELEDIIRKHPGVKDAAVAGKAAGIEVGFLPTAFVVKADNNITEKDINDCVEKEKLHDTKRLRGGVIFTEEIPRNTNGKIMRAKLKQILNPA